MIQPLFIIELLTSLNLGEQLMVAAVLLFVAFEGIRVLRFGKRAGSLMGSLVFYAIIIAVVFAGVVFAGWFDPNVDKIVTDAQTWGTTLFDMAVDWIPNPF